MRRAIVLRACPPKFPEHFLGNGTAPKYWGGNRETLVSGNAAAPYSCTGPWPQLPCASAAWALDLETGNSHQRLGQTGIFLRFRVQLTEYYNFGRIEPGRHVCTEAIRVCGTVRVLQRRVLR